MTNKEDKDKSLGEILEDRGTVYGSFKVGVQGISDIMDSLEEIHLDANKKPMDSKHRTELNFLVIKLVRLASSPRHEDSLVDLCGYATLIKEQK